MEADFLDMMPDRITVLRFTGVGFHGGKEYDEANPREYQCRIVGKGIALRRTETEDSALIVDIYADTGNDTLTLDDKITLPADPAWIDSTPEIFSIGRYTDEEGQHHTKIQCGWMYHRQGQ
jgi:hypothetical protein